MIKFRNAMAHRNTNLVRGAAVAVAFLALTSAWSSPNKRVQEVSRVNAIWDAASDRISSQVDTWFDDGDFPATIELLKMQAELYPADYEVWTNLGWMQENIELWDAAMATYIRFRRQNPQDPDNSLPLAEFLFRRKAFDKIPPILEPAIAGNVHANVFRILAHSYEKQGMFQDAKRIWTTYVARDPGDLQARANLAKVVRKLSEPAKRG